MYGVKAFEDGEGFAGAVGMLSKSVHWLRYISPPGVDVAVLNLAETCANVCFLEMQRDGT